MLPEQHRYHHLIARIKRTNEPVGAAKASGKLLQPVADATKRVAIRVVGLISFANIVDEGAWR